MNGLMFIQNIGDITDIISKYKYNIQVKNNHVWRR